VPMDWAEESGRRSPSLDLIDRPPSLYRPPIRSPASPRLSQEEVDELTNPNLPYRTGYTYAFSKSYRSHSIDEDDYEVPNMAGTSFYHDSSIRDDGSSVIHSSSFASTIYEEAVTAYYKTITAIYCSLATTYAGGRSIIEWIYYILYSIAYGVSYVGSHGGQWIGEQIYRVPYSIAYAVWLVLDSTGRVSYNGSSLILQTLFDIVMYIPRSVNALVNAQPPSRRVTYNDDENEVRYFTQNERIVISNGPASSSSSHSSNSAVEKSVFGGLWSSAIKYLKRGRRSHMEPVYELRSRTIEREVGDDTDTDDELGMEERVSVVHHEPIQSVPTRRARSVKHLNEDDVIYDESSSSNILTNLLYLPVDALVGLYTLICFIGTSIGSGIKNTGYYSFYGTTSAFYSAFDLIGSILYYTVYYPITAVGSFVSDVASGSISSSPANDVHHSVDTRHERHVVHHTTALGGAITRNEVAAVPVFSSHDRDTDEDILVDMWETPKIRRRSTRRLSNSSNSSESKVVVSGLNFGPPAASTFTAKTTRGARLVKAVPLAASSSSAFSSSTDSSSSLFAPVGGIVWAVKDSTTTILAKIIDCVTFSYLLIYQCFRAIGQLIGGGASAIGSSIGSLGNAIASGTSTGSSGLFSMIGAVFGTIFTVFRDVIVESAQVLASTGRAIKNGVGAIWSSRPSGATLWNLLLWLLLLLPLILFCLWLFTMPPFKKEHDEVVAEYVKHASSIMEDYYSYGQHHTKSFIGLTVDTIGAGARSLWTIFKSMFLWILAAIFGLWESMLMFLAGFRFFSAPPPLPPPVIVAPSSECPPAPPPVYIPAPAPPPVYIPAPAAPTFDQEALVAAIVAKVTAQMEQRMTDSLNGRMHIVEESVKKAEQELRAKITVTHEPIDYSNLDAMIAAAIRKYDSDKTGLVDYALESAGGQIVSTRCSETYALSTRVEKIFDIPLYYSNYGPRVVIQRNSQALVPGECWAFKGGIGYLTIKLAVPIKVTSVSYEHIPKTISRNGENLSAPKTFTIFAYEKDEYNFASRFELGNFEYDAHGDPLQFFPVQKLPSYPVQIIEFQVDSNYGEQYTCLYRFRVHGDNLKL
ncbi:hypothetical protein PENTCL1PPCAC_29079, partial [Pristionchus entomophagus]